MIVKYNQEFKYIPLPTLTKKQADMFFTIASLADSEYRVKKRKIQIKSKEFARLCGLDKWNYTKIQLYREIKKFFKEISSYKVECETLTRKYMFVCFEKLSYKKHSGKIKIKLQKDFYEMLVNHKLGFTRQELTNFIALRGKYTKTLYRLLRQNISKGILRLEWNRFIELMQISRTLRHCDIDTQILKPAIKNLVSNDTAIFKNLAYKKIKSGGNKVVAIEFSFTTPQTQVKSIEQENPYSSYKGNIFCSNGVLYRIKTIYLLKCGDLRMSLHELDTKGKKIGSKGKITLTKQEFQEINNYIKQ